jgi:hypothetical protein
MCMFAWVYYTICIGSMSLAHARGECISVRVCIHTHTHTHMILQERGNPSPPPL